MSEHLQPEDHAATDGLVSAALEIAARDAAIRRDLKAALLRGDRDQAITHACRLVGVAVPAFVQFSKAA